jgi:hypothetical protein
MTDPSDTVPLDASPKDRLALAVETYGESTVADKAAALLGGANAGEEFLLWVGGRHAHGVLDGAPALYWPEVWGARALLYAWDPAAASAVRLALSNQAWRVREMSCRVVIARDLPFVAEIEPLLADEVARVRAVAARALAELGEYEQGVALKALLHDPEVEVRRAAGNSIRAIEKRLDRTIEE